MNDVWLLFLAGIASFAGYVFWDLKRDKKLRDAVRKEKNRRKFKFVRDEINNAEGRVKDAKKNYDNAKRKFFNNHDPQNSDS